MSQVELVGILNLTPDSFSGDRVNPEEGQYVERVLAEADKATQTGAHYIDVGGQSTRPNAQFLSVDEEWARLEPILPALLRSYNGRISIDTFYPEIVRRVATIGSNFTVNDVTGFNQPEMIQAAAELGLRCIVSHLPAKFGADIQAAHTANEPLREVEEVRDELMTRWRQLVDAGISPKDIILDPGIGFGKTMPLNKQLLEFAAFVPGIDVMIGFSKKRFLGEHRMNKEPNQEAARIAAAAGARYLRVHNPDWYTNL